MGEWGASLSKATGREGGGKRREGGREGGREGDYLQAAHTVPASSPPRRAPSCGERCAHLRAAHTRVRLVSKIMCGVRCARLRAAHTCVRLDSETICGERCRRHTHVSASSPPPRAESAARFCRRQTPSPPRLRHQVRRALRASAGGTRMCPPCLFHHWRRALRVCCVLLAAHASVRLVSATIRGERCALCWRHTHVSVSSPPSCEESTARVRGRHTQGSASSPSQCAGGTRMCPPTSATMCEERFCR